MVFTPKSIVFVMLGAFILFILSVTRAFTLTQALTFLGAYNFLLLLCFALDYRLTPKFDVIRVERDYEHRLSLGADNPINITIENRSKQAIRLIAKDEPPAEFKLKSREFKGTIVGNSTKKFVYYVFPPKRGDYHFGAINIRFWSKLGLFMRQARVVLPEPLVRVYPNILEIRRFQILSRQGYLIEAGLKSSKVVGLGTDFESLREYQPDDEYRRINWGATSRRGRLITNQYEVEKSQNILLVIDTGRMMSKDSGTLTLLDHAINASLLLGYVGVEYDDKVGLIAFANEIKFFLPPGKGKPQLQKILAGLYNLQPEIVESDYQLVCQYIGLKNRKRSLICIFTDLIDEDASQKLLTYVSTLTSRHLVMCITILDSHLVAQSQTLPVTSQELYEKGIALTVLRNRDKAIALLKNRGVVVVNVPPEEISIATINKYLELKSLSRL